MDTTPHAGAPYREPSAAPSMTAAAPLCPMPWSHRLATLALLVATALSASTSAQLAALMPSRCGASVSRPDHARSSRPRLTLREAAEELSRRQHTPLVIADDLPMGALRLPVPEVFEGSSREAVRALDAWAAPRGLWFHDVDGVMHLERASATASLDCDDTLDVCATRLERLASVIVQRAGDVGAGRVRLRLTHGVPALSATVDALRAAGYAVDTRGRTIWVSAISTPPPPPSVEGTRVLRRSDIDRWLRASPSALRDARIVPVARGRRVVGVRVFGVRRDGPLAALGLADGDLILRVNGLDLASPDRCVEAYAQLRQADEVVLELERRGRRMSWRYALV